MSAPSRNWIHYLTYSHIWVAGSTVMLGWQTLSFTGMESEWDFLALFLFAGTLAAYSLQRLTGYRQLSGPRLHGIGSVQAWWPWLIALGFLMSLVAFFNLSIMARWIAIASGMLSIAYIFPVGQGRRIRNIPGLKIFIIGCVWTLTTIWLPLAQHHAHLDVGTFLGFLGARFLFIFAITLPFDLRDALADQEQNTLTLPLWLGWPACRRIGWMALLLAATIDGLLWSQEQIPTGPFAANLVTYSIAAWMILQSDRDRPDSFFSFWMDGLMYLPFLLTTLASLV